MMKRTFLKIIFLKNLSKAISQTFLIASTAKITYSKKISENIIKMFVFFLFHEAFQKFIGNLLLIYFSIFMYNI